MLPVMIAFAKSSGGCVHTNRSGSRPDFRPITAAPGLFFFIHG
jgi:hypothetical protein